MTTEDQRLAELEREIRIRLRKICESMTDADFSDLVRQIAINTRRGELRAGRLGLGTEATIGDPTARGEK